MSGAKRYRATTEQWRAGRNLSRHETLRKKRGRRGHIFTAC